MADVFDFLAHNWVANVGMDTVWQTDVIVSPNRLAESRRSLVAAPRRFIDVQWSAMNKQDATRAYFQLLRATQQRLRIPLYQDVSVTTGIAAGTSIPCDTTNRRFYEGQLVAIHTKQGELARDIEYGTVDVGGVAPGGLTLSGALSNTYQVGSSVYPVLVVEQELEVELQAITDEKARLTAGFTEVFPVLPAAQTYANLGANGFTQAGSYWVLDIGPEWRNEINIRARRPGREYVLGRDFAVEGFGDRALVGFDLNFTHKDREEFIRMLSFFDAHRGRAIPFIAECPLTLFTPTFIDLTNLVIERYGDPDNYDLFVENTLNASPYVMLTLNDGSRVFRLISNAFSPTAETISLTASGGWPALSLGDIRRVSIAYLCRFDSDNFRESWVTNTVASTTVSVIEVVRTETEAPGPGQDGFFTGGIGELCA